MSPLLRLTPDFWLGVAAPLPTVHKHCADLYRVALLLAHEHSHDNIRFTPFCETYHAYPLTDWVAMLGQISLTLS
jgi:hypothetical protein